MYKYYHKTVPLVIRELFDDYMHTHHHYTRQKEHFRHPFGKQEYTLLTHILVYSLFVTNQDLLLLFVPVCTFYFSGVQAYGDMHNIMFIFIVYLCYSTIALLIGNIPLHYFSQKSLMRIDFCDLNRVVQFPILIIRISFFYINNTSIILLIPLHIEKCVISENCGLFYNYYNITDYSIVSKVLIVTYQMSIQNRTTSILNHHENSGGRRNCNLKNIDKIITYYCHSMYHNVCNVFTAVWLTLYYFIRLFTLGACHFSYHYFT